MDANTKAEIDVMVSSRIDELFNSKLAESLEAAMSKVGDNFSALLNQLLADNKKILAENEQIQSVNASLKKLSNELIERLKVSEPPLPTVPPPCPPPPPPPPRTDVYGNSIANKHYDVLVLSDSIFRHVFGECTRMVLTDEARKRAPWKAYAKPAIIRQYSLGDCRIKKVVCPGARAGRLLDEASSLLVQGYTFSEIIVHCGTNYAGWDYNDTDVAAEIKELFGALNQMFPLSTLTFSEILPRADQQKHGMAALIKMNEALCSVNISIQGFCANKGHRFIYHDFLVDESIDFGDLLARDLLHLNPVGVQIVEDTIRSHIRIFHDPNVARSWKQLYVPFKE